MQPIKIIIEKHPDGYIAYPIGIKSIVVGEGSTYEEAIDLMSQRKRIIRIKTIRIGGSATCRHLYLDLQPDRTCH